MNVDAFRAVGAMSDQSRLQTGATVTGQPRHRRWRPAGHRLALALFAGVLLAGSMPPRQAWFLAPLGVAVLIGTLQGAAWRLRLLLGGAAGLAFFGPTLGWLIDFSVVGFVGLLVLEVGLFGAAAALADLRRGCWWTLPAVLVLLEAVRARFPFGGFPIPGLALGQLDGPLAAGGSAGRWAPRLGLSTGVGAAAAALWFTGRRVRTLIVVSALAATTAAGIVLAAPGSRPVGSLSAVLVQGGGPRGIPAVQSDSQAVTERQVRLSAAIDPGVDLVLWPESSIGVTGSVVGTDEAARVAELARRTGATVVAGVSEAVGDGFRNSAIA